MLAWNQTARTHHGVGFVSLDDLLAQSDVVSLHLLLTDQTRGFLSRARIAAMKRGDAWRCESPRLISHDIVTDVTRGIPAGVAA